jgi:hypothetical protein
MRTNCLLRKTFDAFTAQGRGFSNCTSGKEELETRMRDILRLPVTSTAATKSKKLADSALLGRRQVVFDEMWVASSSSLRFWSNGGT